MTNNDFKALKLEILKAKRQFDVKEKQALALERQKAKLTKNYQRDLAKFNAKQEKLAKDLSYYELLCSNEDADVLFKAFKERKENGKDRKRDF